MNELFYSFTFKEINNDPRLFALMCMVGAHEMEFKLLDCNVKIYFGPEHDSLEVLN